MTTQNEAVRQENRKAKGTFFAVLLVAGLVGGAVGFCGAYFGVEALAGGVAQAGEFFSRQVAHWLLVACDVALPAICLPLYGKAKRLLAGWDGEDENVSNEADALLSKAMWASGTITVIGMFLVCAAYAGVFSSEDGPGWGFVIALAAMIVAGIELMAIQRKMVDLSKVSNPEKKGSVYDLNFQKKWMDSCDEAEKLLIGQCAYKAYNAMSIACIALWVVFTLTALFLDTGFLPVLAVCIIWGVAQSVYCRWAIKLSKPGALAQQEGA